MANDFRIGHVGLRNGVVSLRITESGKPRFITVPNIKKSSGEFDKSTHLFKGSGKLDVYNNEVITQFTQDCLTVFNNNPFISTKDELVNFYESYKNDNKPITLEEYIKGIINEMRASKYKNPSTTYRRYEYFLKSLQKENKILHKNINEVTNNDYKNYGIWLKECADKTGRSQNYSDKMKRFHATIGRALKEGRTDCVLTYCASEGIPDIENKRKNIEALSTNDMSRIEKLDLKKINLSGKNPMFYKELYRDVFLLLYELSIRPIDLFTLNWDDIQHITENGKYMEYWIIIPQKKKNEKNAKEQTVPITDKAKTILDKYKGMSKGNYVLPFNNSNHIRWNLKDNKDFNQFMTWEQSKLYSINHFLKKVAEELNIKIDITCYTARRSTFTHQCSSDNANMYFIAAKGGTSVQMLDKHYVDRTKCVISYAANH